MSPRCCGSWGIAKAQRAWLVAAGLALTGCFGNTTTEFPPGLEPLEDNLVPADDSYPEDLSFLEDDMTYDWVHGRVYVRAPAGDVWRVLKNVDRLVGCQASSWSATEGVEPEYEFSFELHQEVDDIINVAWDERWRFGTVDGSPEQPELAMIRYQKTFGSNLIDLLEGSILVVAARDDVTELQFIEHLDAAGGDRGDMKASMIHRLGGVNAALDGTTPPSCD